MRGARPDADHFKGEVGGTENVAEEKEDHAGLVFVFGGEAAEYEEKERDGEGDEGYDVFDICWLEDCTSAAAAGSLGRMGALRAARKEGD
jgi:hypothetical protein